MERLICPSFLLFSHICILTFLTKLSITKHPDVIFLHLNLIQDLLGTTAYIFLVLPCSFFYALIFFEDLKISNISSAFSPLYPRSDHQVLSSLVILSITWNHFPSPPKLNSHHLFHSVVWSPVGFCTIWPKGLSSKFQSKYYPISNLESILPASFWSNFSFSHPLPLIYSPILHALCHSTIVLCSLVLLTNKGHSPHLFSQRQVYSIMLNECRS